MTTRVLQYINIGSQVFPDNACRREILNLDVNCSLNDCKWVGKLKDIEVSPTLQTSLLITVTRLLIGQNSH